VIENQKLICGELSILFNVDNATRSSFLPLVDDNTTNSKKQILSWFKNNCYLYENWCIDDSIKNLWLQFSEDEQQEISKQAEINLFYLKDRIGNILYFKEINEVDVTIFHQNDKFLTLSTSMKGKFVPNKYIANIEIKSYDDIILKECFVINERLKDFKLQDEEYNILLEIYNMETGKCVYKNNLIFMKTLSLCTHIVGPEIVLNDEKGNKIHAIQTHSKESISTVGKTDKSKIIQYQLARSNFVRRQLEAEDLTFKGFKGKQLKDAEEYFTELLKQIAKTKQDYIYIADPYFLSAEFDIHRFINYMNIFAAVQDKEVRILTCSKNLPKSLKNFRKNNKNKLFKNVKIKSILELSQKDEKEISSFHDRWLASEVEEYWFTNSLNNFKNDVSFFKSLKHYFEEAEELWQIPFGTPNYIIQEFYLYE
jgi:ribosomal protein S8